MATRLYQPKTLIVKPISKPKKINIFRHIVLFINDENMDIERAIPDFEERHIDSKSSNIDKINNDTYMSYFEIINPKSYYLPSNEPIFQITVFEGQADSPNIYVGPKVVSSKCLNLYTTSIEEIILESCEKAKVKKI